MKNTPKNKPSMNSVTRSWITIVAVMSFIELAGATEFMKTGKALGLVLEDTKVFEKCVHKGKVAKSKKSCKKKKDSVSAFYTKNKGKAKRYAFIEKGIYEPNCTHTWVIGVDAQSHKVTGIQVIEMSCPHAFPTQKASYLDQYIGKGPSELTSLSGEIKTIAKATGSSELTTDAVQRAIKKARQLKGKF